MGVDRALRALRRRRGRGHLSNRRGPSIGVATLPERSTPPSYVAMIGDGRQVKRGPNFFFENGNAEKKMRRSKASPQPRSKKNDVSSGVADTVRASTSGRVRLPLGDGVSTVNDFEKEEKRKNGRQQRPIDRSTERRRRRQLAADIDRLLSKTHRERERDRLSLNQTRPSDDKTKPKQKSNLVSMLEPDRLSVRPWSHFLLQMAVL